MKYVIASGLARNFETCREFLGHIKGLEIRFGSAPETGWDCDAEIVWFPIAHDRYGGFPKTGVAQVLDNSRFDGAPGIVLATPPLMRGSASNADQDAENERQVLEILRSCVAAFVDEFGRDDESKILIHFEGSGIARPNLEPTLKALEKFLKEEGYE